MKLVKPEEMENQVGVSLPAGEWFEIDQARINAFADCTEDHQFITWMRRRPHKPRLAGRLLTDF
jgi:acyl dehydratase